MARSATTRTKGDGRGRLGGGTVKGQVYAVTRARADAIQRHAELDAATVIEQIARGALYDPGDYFEPNGDLKPLAALTEAQRQAIAGIKVKMQNLAAGDGVVDRVVEYKLVDRAKFVDMAGRYHALFRDKIEVTGVEDSVARLLEGRQRARNRQKPCRTR